ncbi:unnamed protein product [Auanema sp. JU1783]|nr:unnamed protein product [Auanema sp. JU1783]
MDIYFTHTSITDISLYNCSILTEKDIEASHAIRRPLRGFTALLFGVVIVIYALCLQVMLNPKIFCKACYKIMFFIGLYEITTVIIHDIVNAYTTTFGVDFCDMPNINFFLGCVYAMCWAGASYLCLYLAFNRMLEILKFRRSTIEWFFSPHRTYFGCLISFLYSLSFFFCNSPVVYSNLGGTMLPDPLFIRSKVDYEFRSTLLIVNNFGVVVFTFLLYGYFCVISYKNIRLLPEITAHHIRLQHQVFIQASLMCGFNFFFSITYAIYVVFPKFTSLPEIVFVGYQYSIGLQALIYLFFNQTIRSGVKENICGALGIKISSESIVDMRTDKMKASSSHETAISGIHSSTASQQQ